MSRRTIESSNSVDAISGLQMPVEGRQNKLAEMPSKNPTGVLRRRKPGELEDEAVSVVNAEEAALLQQELSADEQAPMLLAQAETAAVAEGGVAASGAATGSGAASGAAVAGGAAIGSGGLLALAAVGIGAVAAGSGGGGGSSAPAPMRSGSVIDGYVAGATVFIDRNGNRQLEADEPSTTTDEAGNFSLPANVAGDLVSFGGTDISTGLPFVGILRAPAGATAVTPLTTLMVALMDEGATAAAAQTQVLAALGLSHLDAALDLSNFDPLAQPAGDANALAIQKAAVQVATLISNLTERLLEITGAGSDQQDEIADALFSRLADLLSDDVLVGTALAVTGAALIDGLGAADSIGGVALDADDKEELAAAKTFEVETLAGLAESMAEVSEIDSIGAVQGEALTKSTYTLQLLHFADAEAGMLASGTAPYLAAMVDKFEDEYANSITLAGGDNFIPGPFMAAGTDAAIRSIFNNITGSTITGTMPVGAVDIALHNLIGVEASAIGNHEFDLGSNTLGGAFKPTAAYTGAKFPYVSANLDFSGDNDLKGSFVDTTAIAGLEKASDYQGKIVPSAVIEKGGAKIGLVGATTQILESISSPSGTKVKDDDNITSDDLDLLAAQLQPVIDDLVAQGVNKIILLSHLQLLGNELALAGKLSGVDIILAAGSNTRLGDADDQAVEFPGHAASFADTYPIQLTDKDGNPTMIVNTDNEFTYLGRLVVDFDENGHVITDSIAANVGINGAYASTAENVAKAWGIELAEVEAIALAEGTRGGNVKALTDAVQEVILEKDGNVYGHTNVYLEGERVQVRSQETNLGNLSADANAYAAEQALGSAAANTFIVSLKNGGGIRTQIGTLSAPKSDGTVDKLPPDGGVSQLDVENSLRFNNQLIMFDTTPEGLKAILEHGVAAGTLQGRFPQLGGVSFSWDATAAAGSRVRDIALIGDGYQVNLYDDGVLLSSAPALLSVVTLSFLANGGDAYPIKANGENFRYIVELADGSFALTDAVDESLNLTVAENVPGGLPPLGEQAAFEAYMKAFHATPDTAFNEADTPMSGDTRIQNLAYRDEDVLGDPAPELLNTSVDGEGNIVTLYFSEPLDTVNTPSIDQFRVDNNGLQTITRLQVVNNQVILELSAPLDPAHPVKLSFVDPNLKLNDANTLQDKAGNDVASFSDFVVGNWLSQEASLSESMVAGGTLQLAGAEISAYDPASMRLFVTSFDGLQVIQLDAQLNMTLLGTIALGSNDINSVAVHGGRVAVAVAAADKTEAGDVFFLDAAGTFGDTAMVLGSVKVGALPDMLVFTKDGSKVLVANEGERNLPADIAAGKSAVDPEGSVSIIDISAGIAGATVTTATFAAFNDQVDALKAAGVRLFAGTTGFETTTVAQDLEPEYIAISPDGKFAFVTLQENNAIAILDLASGQFTDIVPLGLKSFLGLPFDGSDRDGAGGTQAINLRTDSPVFGQYMPDSIASFTGVDGKTYFVIANEGDDRDDFVDPDETIRAGNNAYDLDDATYANETALKNNAWLGRLKVTNKDGLRGDIDGDGDVDQILAYGARSFSIINEDGIIVFDSGSHIEQLIASTGLYTSPDGSGSFDDGRSGNKGPEPEGIAIGIVGDKVLAFVGLERGGGGVMVYDVTNPGEVSFVQYLRQPGDVSPEGLTFVSAEDSPNGVELLFVTNEVSNTVTVFRGIDGHVATYTPNQGTSVGSSDASTAIALDAQWMVVADDEANVLRVYPREGGAAVLEWSYALNGPMLTKELDLEASVLVGNTLYLVGSHSNKKDGSNAEVDRSHLFAVTISGIGAETQFTYIGKFSGLESQLVAWDSGNVHGLGANYFGFAASAAAGIAPERLDGFSIEGLVTSPDDSALWLSFRAPQTDIFSRDKALIVPVSNYAALVAGSAVSAIFGAPIELDLGGRGIRSISRAEDGNYLILAGPSGKASDVVDRDFALFIWNGEVGNAPVELANDLDALSLPTGGSFESIVSMPATLAAGGTVQLLLDNGDTVWAGKTSVSKDLPAPEQQFQGVFIKLQAPYVDTDGPLLKQMAPTDDAAGVPVDSAFVLSFNEAIVRGEGSITLRKADGTVVETFNVASSDRISVDYNVLSIDPMADLDYQSGYYLTVDSGAILDHKGNAFDGLQGDQAYNFVTAGVPTELVAGDILFVAGNAEAPDAIAFVLLKAISGGTTIGLTDRDYSSATGFAGITNEAAFVWKADRDYAAGTIVTIQTDTDGSPIADKGTTLGGGGGVGKSETYYAFQGGSIAGLADGAAGVISGEIRFLASLTLGGVAGDIPAELAAADAALSFTVSPANQTNARYVGSLDASDPAALAARIRDVANWEANYTKAPGFGLVDGSFYGAPLLTGAEVDGEQMTLSWNTAIDNVNLPATSAFSISASGGAVTVTSVSASGNTLLLELSRPLIGGESVALAYADPTAGDDAAAIQLPSGADALSFVNQPVVNISPDSVPPTLLSVSPQDEASAVSTTADIVLTFSEPLAKGSGNITLKGLDGAADVVIPVSSGEVAISGSVVTINPAGALAAGKQYAVLVDAGAFTDISGNAFAGVLSETAQNFTTVGRQDYTLLITEVNSSGTGGDFFELFNYGSASIDLSGWKWTDEAASFDTATAVFAAGTTLAPGASLLVVQSSDATAFKAAWGLADDVQVVAVGGPGLGKQDAVVVFDASGFVATAFNYDTDSITASDGTLIETAGNAFGTVFWDGQHAGTAYNNGSTAVDKRSAVWDGLSFSNPTYRVATAGEDGSYAQTGDASTVGSPAALPTLGVGDLFFLAANADSTDAFAFTVLKAVTAGTSIGFTDRDYNATTGMPASGESAFLWTADRDYDAGTVFTIQPDVAAGNNPLANLGVTQGKGGGISATAETIYAFLGDIAGLGNGAAGAINIDSLLASINVGGASAGDVPGSISGASLSFAEDNAKYIGSLDISDVVAFRDAVRDVTNWSVSDDTSFSLANNSLFPGG